MRVSISFHTLAVPGTFSACPNFRAALSADVLNVRGVPTKMHKRNGGFDLHSISSCISLHDFTCLKHIDFLWLMSSSVIPTVNQFNLHVTDKNDISLDTEIYIPDLSAGYPGTDAAKRWLFLWGSIRWFRRFVTFLGCKWTYPTHLILIVINRF